MAPHIFSNFHVHSGQSHLKWSKAITPVLTVDSQDVVTFDTIDGSNGQITPTSTIEDVLHFKAELADPLFGPVYVRGAEPGDTLEVEVLELKTSDWGWTAIMPGFGVLTNEFPEAHLKIWELDPRGSYATFKDGIRIPTHPFLGVMGVAPAEGEFPTIPPLDTGGNIDTRHIIAGTKLFLPVRAPGALFSCGDGHAAQGDGEVCGTAIETPMQVKLRLTVRKDMGWVTSPNYTAPSSTLTLAEDKGYYAVLGVDPDLLEATRKAVRGIIEYLVQTKDLTRVEAYMLASVSISLRVSEVVNVPNYAVSASVPLHIFTNTSSHTS
ncbi:Acetamidase/Formamidase [Trichoderma aethiopicum]